MTSGACPGARIKKWIWAGRIAGARSATARGTSPTTIRRIHRQRADSRRALDARGHVLVGDCLGRHHRNRRSTRHRACRAPPRTVERPPGSRCPNRSLRTSRRDGGGAARSGDRFRFDSDRVGAASRTRSRARTDAPCRREISRDADLRPEPRVRSCTRTECRRSCSTRSSRQSGRCSRRGAREATGRSPMRRISGIARSAVRKVTRSVRVVRPLQNGPA